MMMMMMMMMMMLIVDASDADVAVVAYALMNLGEEHTENHNVLFAIDLRGNRGANSQL